MKKVKVSKKSLWKAVRENCLNCVCSQHKEVELCTDFECKLYPYRFGRPLKLSDLVKRENELAKY